MTEMLFVEILRRYAATLSLDQTGWLAGMRTLRSAARSRSCTRPKEAWTLERLG